MGNSLHATQENELNEEITSIGETQKCTKEQEEDDRDKVNVTLQLFQYRQQIGLKAHQKVKWATSKLLLTEELLKQKQQQYQVEYTKQTLNTDTSWVDAQLAMLTDDEDELDFVYNENFPPLSKALSTELQNLMNYRLTLRDTILELAQEKLKKREKKKLKRLKRRTLISSKKPSNKDKQRSFY